MGVQKTLESIQLKKCPTLQREMDTVRLREITAKYRGNVIRITGKIQDYLSFPLILMESQTSYQGLISLKYERLNTWGWQNFTTQQRKTPTQMHTLANSTTSFWKDDIFHSHSFPNVVLNSPGVPQASPLIKYSAYCTTCSSLPSISLTSPRTALKYVMRAFPLNFEVAFSFQIVQKPLHFLNASDCNSSDSVPNLNLDTIDIKITHAIAKKHYQHLNLWLPDKYACLA